MRTSSPPSERPRVIGYTRVSTAEQSASGLGLDAQRAAIEAAAGRLGLALVHVATDSGVSGSLPADERPALMEAIGMLGKGDVLLVAKRDRLARDVLAAATIEALVQRKGARIVSAAGEGNGDEPTDVLMRQIVDAFSQYERAIIRSRTKAALAVKRTRGERVGRPCKTPPEILRRVTRARKRGVSWKRIAASLQRDGIATIRGGSEWRASTVQRVYQAAQYAAALAGAEAR